MSGYIYFIQAEESKRIKIGYSENPKARIKNLQVASHEQLTELAQCEGKRLDEKALHDFFKSHRIRGEWFNPANEIMSLAAKTSSEIRREIDKLYIYDYEFCRRIDQWAKEHKIKIPDIPVARKIRSDLSTKSYFELAKLLVPRELAQNWFVFSDSDRADISDELCYLKSEGWSYSMILALDYSFFPKLFCRNVPQVFRSAALKNAAKILCVSPDAYGIDPDEEESFQDYSESQPCYYNKLAALNAIHETEVREGRKINQQEFQWAVVDYWCGAI